MALNSAILAEKAPFWRRKKKRVILAEKKRHFAEKKSKTANFWSKKVKNLAASPPNFSFSFFFSAVLRGGGQKESAQGDPV